MLPDAILEQLADANDMNSRLTETVLVSCRKHILTWGA